MSKREVLEGMQTQGQDEEITYTITVTPAPTSIVGVTVWDERADEEVTSEVMPAGAASFVGSVITLPPLLNLRDKRSYRVEVAYSDGVNKIEPYFMVTCER